MEKRSSRLSQIAMVARNFGDAPVLEDVLKDWFHFLGGKPGEVVMIDAGSNAETHAAYWRAFQAGLIDKLQVIQPSHAESDHNRGFVQIHTAGISASQPYLLWFNVDTLPYRSGHDGWLEEAIDYLDRDGVCVVGGSFNKASKYQDAWDGWYFSKKCSFNFALMKASTYLAAINEFAGSFIASGFQGMNPADATNQGRYLVEVAMEHYIQRHNLLTLCKIEDANWSVFHTNAHEARLRELRQRYLAREGVLSYLNAGYADPGKDLVGSTLSKLYYGQPIAPANDKGKLKKLRATLGGTSMGQYWRAVKQLATSKVF